MPQDEELEEGQPRLLSTDNFLVVPVKPHQNADNFHPAGVIHSWAVPSLVLKWTLFPGD